MKHRLLCWFALAWTAVIACADGLIIIHEPFPMPRIPPPWPEPRPPYPIPLPHPRPYTFAPMEVRFHRVEAKVRDQVATTTVDQEFFNPNDRQFEGTYLFPVPTGAHLDKFSMEVNGQQVEAQLLPADKARQIYEDIVRKHRDPALLEYLGRDVFKVRIFPIEPHSTKRVKLAYTQLLKSDAGLIGYLYPLNTEKYSAQPIPTVSLKLDLESRRPLKSIYSPSHNVEIHRHGDHQATIGFEAKDVKPDTDFQLFFAAEGGDVGVNLMTCRTGSDDGYFLLLAAPAFELKEKTVVAKDIALVLDTSGSMAGKKLEQAKKALQFCIENLNASDRFEVIRFSTESEPLFGKLVEATPANRERAGQFVRELKPIGGTALQDALLKALATRPSSSDRPCFVIFLTDGLPTVGETDNDRIVTAVKGASGTGTRVFCFGIGHDVNTHLLDRITETTQATSAYVLPEEDLEVKVSNFFSKIKEPILANVKLTFPDAVRVTKLYPSPVPDLFKGEQIVLAGRYGGHGTGALVLEGNINGAGQKSTFDVRFPESAPEQEFIPRLWATRRIGYLLDEIRLHGEHAELRDEVTDLARKYGIVTPYTAYLIHEDEQHRGVPLAQQSLPQLQSDGAVRQAAREAWVSFQQDATGGPAVAAARYGLAQKSANQVGEALRLGTAEAARSAQLRMLAAAAPPSARPAVAGGAASAGAPVGPPGAPTPDPSAQLVAYTQQTRFAGGRTFFLNQDQWIDTRVAKLRDAKTVRLPFASNEYFDLLARHPEASGWLALGPNVQFALGDTVYDVRDQKR